MVESKEVVFDKNYGKERSPNKSVVFEKKSERSPVILKDEKMYSNRNLEEKKEYRTIDTEEKTVVKNDPNKESFDEGKRYESSKSYRKQCEGVIYESRNEQPKEKVVYKNDYEPKERVVYETRPQEQYGERDNRKSNEEPKQYDSRNYYTEQGVRYEPKGYSQPEPRVYESHDRPGYDNRIYEQPRQVYDSRVYEQPRQVVYENRAYEQPRQVVYDSRVYEQPRGPIYEQSRHVYEQPRQVFENRGYDSRNEKYENRMSRVDEGRPFETKSLYSIGSERVSRVEDRGDNRIISERVSLRNPNEPERKNDNRDRNGLRSPSCKEDIKKIVGELKNTRISKVKDEPRGIEQLPISFRSKK
jgi:hypothetical protein